MCLSDTLIGTEITLVTGNDVDSGPALAYSLHLDPSAAGKFGIHRYTGGVSLTAPLDFEEKTWYTVTVRATDSQHHTEANITILVEDVNDNVPAFTQDLYQVGTAQLQHRNGGTVETFLVLVQGAKRCHGLSHMPLYSNGRYS